MRRLAVGLAALFVITGCGKSGSESSSPGPSSSTLTTVPAVPGAAFPENVPTDSAAKTRSMVGSFGPLRAFLLEAGEELPQAGRALPRCGVEEDAGAVLVVRLGVVDHLGEAVAQRGGVASPTVVRLGRKEPGLVASGGGEDGEAGLGGGVAFGVEDVDVVAGGEAELSEAEQRLGLAGAGEAEDDGAKAEGAVGEGAPLPRSLR